ncbi:MAG TPA: DUF1203 domain-containing protein [Phenylobacterium sp.]
MTYEVIGLAPETFQPLFGLSDAALRARGVIRREVGADGRFPCRITLEDAKPGDSVLLLNHESHNAATPYRSAYAIFVNEKAREAASFHDEPPPVFRDRPIALRIFDAAGMLIGADLARGAEVDLAIRRAFADPRAAYIHAHNAAHGCFAAQITRAV